MKYSQHVFSRSLAGLMLLGCGSLALSGTEADHDSAKLRSQAKITEAAARATALKEVPAGLVQSSELEKEHGKLVYSFDIKVAGASGVEEVTIDAITGKVVAHEHESAQREKAEAAAERAEEKATPHKP